MRLYRRLVRPVLFLLPPETAHALVVGALRVAGAVPGARWLIGRSLTLRHPALEREAFGIRFPNPVGLAAGFDKDARLFGPLAALGFGFVEVGTVTPQPQPGNPRPRSFRLPADSALINRMGLNSKGVNAMAGNLSHPRRVILGGNIGKNTATPGARAPEDYLEGYRALYALADYFVVNVSCPNVGSRLELQDRAQLTGILAALTGFRARQAVRKPLLLKVSPDLTPAQLDETVDLALAMGLDGFVATNTTTRREGLNTPAPRLETIGQGGLSGAPLRDRATEVIRQIHGRTEGRVPIVGVGGVMTPEDALEKLEAGATLVQVYTGMVYYGPSLARDICRRLIARPSGPSSRPSHEAPRG